ncbi:MAG: S4 domain-containing protein YaaA [Anaeromicrobium sp.]|jgi:ribosome-associated protein|uniref:S4 domain-containing protein YaaA n=1 Tax=Anaeromicrobium sp. TaxID=1929132 RepID=UPI0025CBE35E|nr:S4 domain-containing protein YaaA [Anaeromicrobium sp.]MCT4594654.1 S4 domain-containing protein YaaA [Anaeromicrobium sp.]
MEKIQINGEFIQLDKLLKLAAVVQTGGHAKFLITSGEVTVNGEVETRRGKKIYKGDKVQVEGESIEVI